MAETKHTAGRLTALKAGDWYEFSANDRPKCPHCGEYFDIEAEEQWRLYDVTITHDVTCPSCDLDFQVNSSASWSFSTDEQDDRTEGSSHA
jgi:phage terminase large subunit GpA-like protein